MNSAEKKEAQKKEKLERQRLERDRKKKQEGGQGYDTDKLHFADSSFPDVQPYENADTSTAPFARPKRLQ